jgi:DNA-binding transcriptional MerR regulator
VINIIKLHAEGWLTTRELAARHGVLPGTVRGWARKGRIQAIRIPPDGRGRIFVKDPRWIRLDPSNSPDPSEWICILSQVHVAQLLNVSSRALRYMEADGRARPRLVGHRKFYSLSEVRRLLAQRQAGHKKVSRSERERSLLQWARRKLELTPEQHLKP